MHQYASVLTSVLTSQKPKRSALGVEDFDDLKKEVQVFDAWGKRGEKK
jgi:hypothetical protein